MTTKSFALCRRGTQMFGAVILLACALAADSARAATYYVATNGNDTAAGTDWTTALLTISNAVAMADGGNDVVVLSNGVHYLFDQIFITNAIVVRGMTTNRNNVVVNGNFPANTNRCFFLENAGAEVADLTIINGFAAGDEFPYGANGSKGGGVYINTNGCVRNCLVTGNTATNSGGGIYLYRSGIVTNCAINDNVVSNSTSATQGGGIYLYSAGNVYNCIVSNNRTMGYTDTYSGGMHIFSTVSVVQDCQILNNRSVSRGGGYIARRISQQLPGSGQFRG